MLIRGNDMKLNKYGFKDKEIWNFDETIVEFLLPRMKRFREVNNGYPVKLSWDEWNNILDKIINNLEFYKKDFNDLADVKEIIKKENEQTEALREALKLIAEYIEWLWW
jgi:hypothetical protein